MIWALIIITLALIIALVDYLLARSRMAAADRRAYQSELASRHRRKQARLNRRNLIVGWACMLAVMAMVAYAMVGSL